MENLMIHNNQNNEEFQARTALFALGALSLHEARAFENELAQAPAENRTEAAGFETVVQQLGLGLQEATPSAEVRQNLIAQIAQEPRPPKNSGNGFQPNRATNFHIRQDEGKWIQLNDNAFSKQLFIEPTNGYVTSLLRIEAGGGFPNHHHKGNEQCLVITGDFEMNGIAYGPGDFIVAMKGTDHLDIFTKHGATVLLVSPPAYDLLPA